ncbi:CLI_3235 family bacteriocin precursor [Lachnospiraceae bacterium MD308]|nr:CLI_3235 family bacteriocin precursor [Lachnospiraceae bacterium MD308]
MKKLVKTEKTMCNTVQAYASCSCGCSCKCGTLNPLYFAARAGMKDSASSKGKKS